ncbi:Putative ribonuclease H protein At1g65750 [Linum perenne]
MQTTLILETMCSEIEKRICSFVWGSTTENQKLHLVDWNSIYLPKECWGLGLKSAVELNQAFMTKMVWSLFTRPEDMWVKVIMTKYLKKVKEMWCSRGSSRMSNVWCGIKQEWDTMNLGLQWNIQNG